MSNPPNEVPNPYVGPRSFQVGERIYGRKREANQLLNLIIAERIVLLHSPSGAGKTSLIQAAMIPKLVKMKFRVLPVVRVNLDVSEALAEGFECNRYVFSALLSLEEDVPVEKKISTDWLAKMSLPDYLDQRYRPESSMDVEVLIFDQFEEILTLDPTDQEDKEEFFKQVGEALDAPNRWALFSIRDDYVASLDPYLLWIPNRLSTNFRLDLLGIEAARRAIQEPAREAGVEFEEAAAEKLVDDLRRVRVQQPDGSVERQLGPYVEPVQMQVVCFRVWENPRPDQQQITADDLEELGQVDQSLVDSSLAEYYALQVVTTTAETGIRERAIREWFDRRLITEQGVRGTVVMGSETSGGLDNNAISLLVDAHLVRAERRGGATWYELSHDRLLEPVRESNIAWYSENLSLLQRQADLWYEEGRKGELLLVGHTLDEAEEWAKDNVEVLTQVEEDFLNASLERRKRRERVHALEQEKLEEQTRSALRAKRWTAAIGIVGLLFVAVAVYASLLFVNSRDTSNFIEAIVACEGGNDDSCLEAADSAAGEEKYLLLVSHACEDGMQAVVKEDDQELFTAVEGACQQVVEMSIKPASLPLLNELCENLWHMGGLENTTRNICNQAVKLAPSAQNLSHVYSTCSIGSIVGLNEDDIDSVCKRAVDLVTTSDDLSSLSEICRNPMNSVEFSEQDVQRACDRYIAVAIESEEPNDLRYLCLDYGGIGLSDEDAQKACKQVVDLAVEKDDSYVVREICLSGRNADLPENAVQRACGEYQKLAERLSESSDDAYLLRDMCTSGREAGLKEDIIRTACRGAADLAVESNDPNVLGDLCIYYGTQTGLLGGEAQRVCGHFFDLAVSIADESKEPYTLGEMCISGIELGLEEEDFQAACDRAIAIAREVGDQRWEAAHLGNLGDAYLILGDVEPAIEKYEAALVIVREIGDQGMEGNALGNLGNAYAAFGELELAIENFEAALAIAREIGVPGMESTALGSLGKAYAVLGEFELAIENFEAALAIAQEISIPGMEGITLGNLGNAYAAIGELELAIENFEAALVIAREIGDLGMEGNALGSLGKAYAILGEVERPIENFEAALAIAREIGDRRGEAEYSWDLGLVYEKQGDLSAAISGMQVRVDYEREIGHPDAEKHAARIEELRAKLDQ